MPQNGTGLENGGAAELERATELFARHSAGVYRYCLRRLGSREEAEDALQVTYLNAWRSLKSGFEPDQHRPWLFQIAANVCSTSLRTKLGGNTLELRDPVVLDSLAGEERAGADELVGLSEALNDLPTRQRHALVLRDWQGLSYKEIAAELAVSVASVETLLFRGRKRVAAALANADWRKAAPSARALLIWPFVFLRTKSAATAGAEHLKIGLVLAGGTVAPLVAFGVIQTFLPGSGQPAQAARPATVAQTKGAQVSVSSVEEASLIRGLRSTANDPGGREPTKTRTRRDRPSEGGRPGSTPAPPDPPVKAGSPAASNGSEKIVLCHGTPATANPGVTIRVSGHASAGLSNDTPGAC
jgi:RNA polymerase sigma-70 factor (ECF subfamily)